MKFNLKVFVITIFMGLLIALAFVLAIGDEFATALFPTISLLSAFIVTGFFIGYLSEGVTFLEPGSGAVILSVLLYFIIPVFNLKGFQGIWDSDWVLIFMNGIILTFAGAWLGEKWENTSLSTEKLIYKNFDWGWMLAGVLMGITASMIVILIMFLIIGPNPESFLVPFVLALFITGVIVGWKSPGYTVLEAAIAGFLSLTLMFNIFRLTLRTEEPIGVWTIIIGLLAAYFESYFGAHIGEKIQELRNRRKRKHKKHQKVSQHS
jgi:hypothetical protein